jgi:excisionase family DNA binding protein
MLLAAVINRVIIQHSTRDRSILDEPGECCGSRKGEPFECSRSSGQKHKANWAASVLPRDLLQDWDSQRRARGQRSRGAEAKHRCRDESTWTTISPIAFRRPSKNRRFEPRFFTLEQTAAYLNVSVAQVYALVRSGGLPAIKIGGRGVCGGSIATSLRTSWTGSMMRPRGGPRSNPLNRREAEYNFRGTQRLRRLLLAPVPEASWRPAAEAYSAP